MDNRNYDQDEILIRQALGNQFPQNADILKGVVKTVETKPKRIFKKGVVAALIAASLMVVTVSAYQMGAFERLAAAIIGQERAEELTPIEIAAEEPELHHDGIAIELVAIEVADRVAYVYFTMQDLIANRLAGDFFIQHHIVPTEIPDGFGIGTGMPQVIHRGDGGVVTFRSRFESWGHSLEGLEMTYEIRQIIFDQFEHPGQAVDINLADFAVDAPVALLHTDEISVINMTWEGEDIPSREYRYAMRRNMLQDGLPVLSPDMVDIGFGLDRVDASISAIGIVNGRLHVQLKNRGVGVGSDVALFLLRNAQDIPADEMWLNKIHYVYSVNFRVAADGSLYWDGDWMTADGKYFEGIFDIDLGSIHEYSIGVSARGSEMIHVGWNVTFGGE
ncbi:MAG: hypothetical protein FWB96_02585 [Defluviitaleaceae bacterium]|nr:hypothetical protein [Defluviitaleaceae bacterium]MCL2263854.1 hypothetical protein [Defluviitaleaceae bacterium]